MMTPWVRTKSVTWKRMLREVVRLRSTTRCAPPGPRGAAAASRTYAGTGSSCEVRGGREMRGEMCEG